MFLLSARFFQAADVANLDFVDDEYKMVLVVRNDLKMGKGKVAAQVSSFHTFTVFLNVHGSFIVVCSCRCWCL